MCDAITLGFIQEIINERVDDDKMFTAFDVSLAVKKLARSKGEIVERHRQMKNSIHQEMDRLLTNGLYERQLLDVSSNLRAFVYFPEGQDPAQYTPLKRFDAPASGGLAIPAPATATPAAVSADDDDDVDDGDTRGDGSPDARGTINVPTYLLRAAGIQPSDDAYIIASKDQGENVLVVTKDEPTDITPLVTYKADPNGSIRISKGQLAAGGLDAKKYEYDGSGNKVIVKAQS